MVAIGNFLFRYRNWLFPLALGLVFLPGPDIFADPMVAVLVGFCIALVGQFVRGLTIGYEYVKRGGLKKKVWAETLVTNGCFRLCRNPMYVGNLILIVGLSVTSNSVTCVLVSIPLFVFAYIAIVAAEEVFLRGKFQDVYVRYAAKVPRWLPRLGSVGGLLRDNPFHWKRVLIKEYATPFGWMTMMFVVCLWHLASHQSMAERNGLLRSLVIAWVLLAVAFFTFRYIRLSRGIVAD
jgi:protein-S-isoprenylcysteine O-methyltransferase Ste14